MNHKSFASTYSEKQEPRLCLQAAILLAESQFSISSEPKQIYNGLVSGHHDRGVWNVFDKLSCETAVDAS